MRNYCLGYVVSSHRPYAELLLCPHYVEYLSRIMNAAMLSALHCADGAIATELLSSPHATFRKVVTRTGCQGRDRTYDQLINSQLLLPLSYLAINFWYPWVGTIHRPSPYQDDALPLSYMGIGGW